MKTQEKRILIDMFNGRNPWLHHFCLPKEYVVDFLRGEKRKAVKKYAKRVNLLLHFGKHIAGESSSGELRKEQIEKVLPENVYFLDVEKEYIFLGEDIDAVTDYREGDLEEWREYEEVGCHSALICERHASEVKDEELYSWRRRKEELRRWMKAGYQNFLYNSEYDIIGACNKAGEVFDKLCYFNGEELIKICGAYIIEQDWIAALQEELA